MKKIKRTRSRARSVENRDGEEKSAGEIAREEISGVACRERGRGRAASLSVES